MDNSRDLSLEASLKHDTHLELGEIFEFRGRDPPDGLFLERLDAFMDKCLADIKAFSEREFCPFEETRQYVAEWHSKYLFQPQPGSLGQSPDSDRASKVRAILCNTSRILESLSETSGVQSFLLAVDPGNPFDGGFLGGSVSGREFWRGLRSGGEAGAKSFKLHCSQGSGLTATTSFSREGSIPGGTAAFASRPSVSLKNKLYEAVRKAIRSTSGIRNAEMKWTNPERLDVYGVRLVGWPPNIPSQNPSSLKVKQNKELLECLESGKMKFELIKSPGSMEQHDDGISADSGQTTTEVEAAEDFSWAYDAEGGDHRPDVPATQQSWETKTLFYTGTTTPELVGHDQRNSDVFASRSSPTSWHRSQHSRKRARNDESEASSD